MHEKIRETLKTLCGTTNSIFDRNRRIIGSRGKVSIHDRIHFRTSYTPSFRWLHFPGQCRLRFKLHTWNQREAHRLEFNRSANHVSFSFVSNINGLKPEIDDLNIHRNCFRVSNARNSVQNYTLCFCSSLTAPKI